MHFNYQNEFFLLINKRYVWYLINWMETGYSLIKQSFEMLLYLLIILEISTRYLYTLGFSNFNEK